MDIHPAQFRGFSVLPSKYHLIPFFTTKPYSLEKFASDSYNAFSLLEDKQLEQRLQEIEKGRKLSNIKLSFCTYSNNFLTGFLELSTSVKGAYVITQAFNPQKGDEPPIQEMVIIARPDLQSQNADVDLEEVVLKSFQVAADAVVDGWMPEKFSIRKSSEEQLILSGIKVEPLIENLPFPRKIVGSLELESMFCDVHYLERALRCMGVFSPGNRDKTYYGHIGGESAYIFSTLLNV